MERCGIVALAPVGYDDRANSFLVRLGNQRDQQLSARIEHVNTGIVEQISDEADEPEAREEEQMVPTDIQVSLCEQRRQEMLTEAERQRLLNQLPRRKQGAGMWRMMARRWRRVRLRARIEGASAFPGAACPTTALRHSEARERRE